MPGEAEFHTQTAVIVQELMKGIMCILLLLKGEGTISSVRTLKSLANSDIT